jgi:hypothetical protein
MDLAIKSKYHLCLTSSEIAASKVKLLYQLQPLILAIML